MRGHNIYFHLEIRKIIFELSLIYPIIWSCVIYYNINLQTKGKDTFITLKLLINVHFWKHRATVTEFFLETIFFFLSKRLKGLIRIIMVYNSYELPGELIRVVYHGDSSYLPYNFWKM